ncbi:MAG: hypothetical protein OXM02_03595 [Bacteroidota bacterium]|nr:hypothetical protein [Bacteroidota bacterium]MDE2833584.1 hypothetical protein [Bacteroidota bacterium]
MTIRHFTEYDQDLKRLPDLAERTCGGVRWITGAGVGPCYVGLCVTYHRRAVNALFCPAGVAVGSDEAGPAILCLWTRPIAAWL